MRNLIVVVLVLLALPVTAGAQHRKRPPQPAAEEPRVPAQFKAVIPPAWPVARRPGRQDTSQLPKEERRHRRDKWGRPGSRPPFIGGGYYALPYSSYYPSADARETARYEPHVELEVTTGELRLEITPATGLQYYIDGMYIGSSAELGTQFDVNAGARRIEIRADGYKPVVFDARFDPGETVTRRGALERVQAAAALPRATGSRTMYVIPGCFMGNARPEPAALPKGCDINRLVTRGGL